MISDSVESEHFSGIDPIPDQFLRLGVDRHDGLSSLLERLDPPIDVLELGIPIGMVAPFSGLAVGLKTIIHLLEQPGDRIVTDLMPLMDQFVRQVIGTLAGPLER